MPSTKWEGLSYPTLSRKVGVVLLGIIFLNTEQKEPKCFARQNDFYALFATNKAKHILNRHFSCSCSDTIYSKSIKKKSKKSHFESLPFLYKSTFSECKDGSRAGSDRII